MALKNGLNENRPYFPGPGRSPKFAAFFAISLFAATSLLPTQVAAFGAVAEGIAPGGAQNGYSSGYGTNYQDDNTARDRAMDQCKAGVNAAADAECQIVSTFTNRCVSLSEDPQNGTPGVGWALGDTQSAADDETLSRCKSTAGRDRQAFCQITTRNCDGTAH